MFSEDAISVIDEMDGIQKLSVYMHYYIKQQWMHSYGKHKDCYSFDEFISKDRIDVRDLGDDWEKNGFAQKIWVELDGIYRYYPRFKDDIVLM